MLHSSHPDLPLRELCFDFSAGLINRDQFQALAEEMLRQRMSCERVVIRCADVESLPLLERVNGLGWLAESLGDWHLLHTALAHNGRLVGLLSCSRAVNESAWTVAEGVTLRRHANVLSSSRVCPISGVSPFVEKEGMSL